MKKTYRRAKLTLDCMTEAPPMVDLSEIFLGWHALASKSQKKELESAVQVRAGDWRMLESYRTAVHM
eukprot:CAMPEP_0195142358 /NCGR_PEP_ID=MMETSP0448-20130528/164458_1 /TAXON_ID=66468 /ORGANISM="Heterocapsa triquestra, Strain CCMP 448" /LENGTH=66 /DNA_ID=CAMNT_0040180755 /DNA_START=18 /DNA_END=215 /DNA_ORIENTATION=-